MHVGEASAMRSSDPDGFEELMNDHLSLVHHVALAWTRDPAEAEELTQRAFVRAFKIFDRFEPGTHFKAWVLRILRYAYLDWRRRRGRRTALSLEDLGPTAEPAAADASPAPVVDLSSHAIDYDQFGDEIARSLRGLPESQRLVLLLADVEGLRYREIADSLGIPIGTVRSSLHRARERLHRELADHARRSGSPGTFAP